MVNPVGNAIVIRSVWPYLREDAAGIKDLLLSTRCPGPQNHILRQAASDIILPNPGEAFAAYRRRCCREQERREGLIGGFVLRLENSLERDPAARHYLEIGDFEQDFFGVELALRARSIAFDVKGKGVYATHARGLGHQVLERARRDMTLAKLVEYT
jgi:hypothetical protein